MKRGASWDTIRSSSGSWCNVKHDLETFLLFSLARELAPFRLQEHVLSLLVSKLFIISRSRAREKRRKVSRSCFTLSRAYGSCFAYRTLISNWIDRCFGQHSWNSVHSLSRDNPRIPTNQLSGSQQPPLLWGQWIRTKPCLKLTRPLPPCLMKTEVTFQLHRMWRSLFLHSAPLMRRLSVTPYTHACL